MTTRESLAVALLTAMCSAPGHLALTEKETVRRAIAMADLLLSELDRRPKDRFPRLQYVQPVTPDF